MPNAIAGSGIGRECIGIKSVGNDANAPGLKTIFRVLKGGTGAVENNGVAPPRKDTIKTDYKSGHEFFSGQVME